MVHLGGVSGAGSADVMSKSNDPLAEEEPAAKRLRAQLSEVSDDMNFNQGNRVAQEAKAQKRDLQTEEGVLLARLDEARESVLEFADNLRSHDFRHAAMGLRSTAHVLSTLKDIKAQAMKDNNSECLKAVTADIAAFVDLEKFLRAVRDVGFNLRELRSAKVPLFLKTYKQTSTHEQWLVRFGSDLVTAFHTETAKHCLDQKGANFAFDDVSVLQSQMAVQPFLRWPSHEIHAFQSSVATEGLTRAMFVASMGAGDNKYRALSAWLAFLAQGSQNTEVSGEFQDVRIGASVVAVWRVVCQVPSENGTITDALSHIRQCDPRSPDAKENTDAFLWAFVAEASVSEPLIVRATEWNDAKLKQQEADHNESMVKDVPNTFQKLLQKTDWDAGDGGEEYSEEVATSSSRVSSHFVIKYMVRIASALGNAGPSEELAKCKEATKQAFQKIEFLFLAQSHRLLQAYCVLAVRGFDGVATAVQQIELLIHNFDRMKADARLAPYLLSAHDASNNTTFVKGKSFVDYVKSLLQLVQHAVVLYKSVEASSFSDDISAHAA